ncbi:trichohyalin-like [Macrobrachium rosenbergii]|uniref:trichohyalin-like n=1 Tax=Macrobrachium rosenbergii TaxID=79674 RepID=UPI0034D65BBE
MCMDIVQFFTYFMALDDSGRPEDSGTDKDQDMVDDDSDCLEDDDSDCLDEAIKKNGNILRLEEENIAKARMIEELKEKVERLAEGRLHMERDIRDLERLVQEKEKQICSLPAEMERLRKEIALKEKDTERLMKENEDKDSKIIILESTAVVLEMEKETLYHNLKEMESDRNRTYIQLSKLNENLERLRQENKMKQNYFENPQQENEDKDLRINGLIEKLEILNTEKQRADENLKQLEQCKKEMVEAKKGVGKLEEQNFQRDREILRLENECSQKQNLVIGLLNETKSAEAEKANRNLNELTRRRIQLEFELAETKEELETMEFEKLEATVDIERLQKDNFAKDKKIRSLESQVKMLKEEKTNGTVKKEQSASEKGDEKKKALGKTRCLRKPQINCKALYRQVDSIEEELRQIRAQKQPSAATKRRAKALAKTPAIKKPLSREESHKTMRIESAARLRRLEQDAKMLRNLYKINSVT